MSDLRTRILHVLINNTPPKYLAMPGDLSNLVTAVIRELETWDTLMHILDSVYPNYPHCANPRQRAERSRRDRQRGRSPSVNTRTRHEANDLENGRFSLPLLRNRLDRNRKLRMAGNKRLTNKPLSR